MATQIWVSICSCNVLLPDGTKPLPDPMLAYHQLRSVVFSALTTILQNWLMITVNTMSFKSGFYNLLPHLPWDNGLETHMAQVYDMATMFQQNDKPQTSSWTPCLLQCTCVTYSSRSERTIHTSNIDHHTGPYLGAIQIKKFDRYIVFSQNWTSVIIKMWWDWESGSTIHIPTTDSYPTDSEVVIGWHSCCILTGNIVPYPVFLLYHSL